MYEIFSVVLCVFASGAILYLPVGGKGWKITDTLSVVSAATACITLLAEFSLGAIFFIPASLFVSKLRAKSNSVN